jgi:CRISPR-associated exonuclease Cas4
MDTIKITGTHINYYHVCKRELWFFSHGLQMEHTSDMVAEGKLIQEYSYPQRAQGYEEVELEGIKIDFYDAKNKIIHEIKKSNKVEDAHTWQVKYYMYILRQKGIDGVKGILEYPKLRQIKHIELKEDDIDYFESIRPRILDIINSDTCPDKIQKKFCKKCSYYDFCWITEK